MPWAGKGVGKGVRGRGDGLEKVSGTNGTVAMGVARKGSIDAPEEL